MKKSILALLLVGLLIAVPGVMVWADTTGENPGVLADANPVVDQVSTEEQADTGEVSIEVLDEQTNNETVSITVYPTTDTQTVTTNVYLNRDDYKKEWAEIKRLEKELKKQWIKDRKTFIKEIIAKRKALKAELKQLKKVGKADWKTKQQNYRDEMSALMARYKELQEKIRQERRDLKALAAALKEEAKFYREIEDYDGEAETLEEAAATDPQDADTYEKLDKAYKKQFRTELKAFVKGIRQDFDVPPVVKDNRTMVPFRKFAEALGAKVTFNKTEQTVTLVKGDNTVVLKVGSKTALVNGQEKTLDVPVYTHGNRLMVPLRFISEGLKADVKYYKESKMIVVN